MRLRWSLSLTSAPTAKPVSLERVRSHCRIDADQPGCDEDSINGWIAAATEQAELHTGRQLITATYELRLDRFPCGYIAIPKPPLSSVTHIKYYAPGDTVLTTWASSNYIVDSPSGPKAQNGRIVLAPNAFYPSTEDRPGAVIVTFVAGYGSADTNVPESIKAGILLRISKLNESREDSAGAFSARDGEASERLWAGFVTYMPEMY